MILTLDVETWGSNSFAFGIIYNPKDDSHKIFYSEKQMKNYLLSLIDKRKRAEQIEIYGHNISYDLNWIFGNYEMFFRNEWIIEKYKDKERKRFTKKLIARDGRLYEAKYFNLSFKDTMNLFPLSLKIAGDVVNYKKDTDLRKKFENATEPEIITEIDINYCLDDCKITYLILQEINKWVLLHGGKLKRTIASTSMGILKVYEPKFDDWLNAVNKSESLSQLDEHFRKSYFGGRTENHNVKGENLYYYDINSLYPYVMSGNKFNFPNPKSLFEFTGDIETALDKYEGVATIKINVPDDLKIPVLPYRVNKIEGVNNGKIIYPTGIFWGCWNFPEIRKALKMGCKILQVDKIICGKRIKSPFKNYIETLYKERLIKKEKNDKTESITKLYLNSCYGKFGQTDYENRIITLKEADEIQKQKEKDLKRMVLAGEISREKANEIVRNSVYDIIFYKGESFAKLKTDSKRSKVNLLCFASYITSYARVEIYNWYEKCNFNIYYSDTDSLISDVELPTGKQMGEMKLEAKVIEASFKGRKDYYLKYYDDNNNIKGMVKRKGFSLKMITHLFLDDRTIVVSEKTKKGLENGNPKICKLYHEAKSVKIDKIIKSREALTRNLNAGYLMKYQKKRNVEFDNGKNWIDTETSIPYSIIQNQINDEPIIKAKI